MLMGSCRTNRWRRRSAAENVTLALGTTFPYWSFTVATREAANAVLTVALSVARAIMMLAAAAVLVIVKIAGVLTPLTVATIV